MSQENKQLIEEINKAFAAGDNEGFLKHCADDVVWVLAGEQALRGVPAIREFMSQMEGVEPPKFSVDKTVAEGDSVICYGEMTMVGTPECAGAYSYCDAYTIADGKITELRSFVIKHKSEDKKNEAATG